MLNSLLCLTYGWSWRDAGSPRTPSCSPCRLTAEQAMINTPSSKGSNWLQAPGWVADPQLPPAHMVSTCFLFLSQAVLKTLPLAQRQGRTPLPWVGFSQPCRTDCCRGEPERGHWGVSRPPADSISGHNQEVHGTGGEGILFSLRRNCRRVSRQKCKCLWSHIHPHHFRWGQLRVNRNRQPPTSWEEA